MGFMDTLKSKASQVSDKANEAIKNAGLDEKFADAKKQIGDAFSETKEKMAEQKAATDAAKAPIDGSLMRYHVIYLGGFPKKPNKKSDPLSFGLNIMEDCFIFKPEYATITSWYGDEIFTIPYDKVVKFEIIKRQVSTTEALMSSNGDTKSLEQENNIQITYVDDNGSQKMTRVEMLTGVTVYGQAEKCRELLDLLREHNILDKLNKSESAPANSGNDTLAQLEKLADLKSKGIISEDEFNSKKAELLAKM